MSEHQLPPAVAQPTAGSEIEADPAVGNPIRTPPAEAHAAGATATELNELVDKPAKVMRIGTMVRQLLEEVRNAPLDDAARTRLVEIHERSLRELEEGLAPELVEELHRINLPFDVDKAPTDAELRMAQAQLVGWLEGLFHGIQTALAAQQLANQQLAIQLQLRQLPPGTVVGPGVVIGADGEPVRADGTRPRELPGGETRHDVPGQYL